jgi:heptosyltransferase-2
MPRLLIVKLGAIGDVIMTLPAAHAMHLAGYRVDWLCGHAVAPILRLYPWINPIAVDERRLLRGSKFDTLRAVPALWRTLTRHSYDIVATLYFDSRYKLLTLPVRAPRKFLLSKSDRATQLVPGRPHASEYARVLLGLPDDENPRPIAPVPPPAGSLPALPSNFDSLIPNPCSSIVLVPAGARNLLRDDLLRRWPIESYVALAEQLLARGHQVILAGGPGDEWASAHFTGLPVTDRIAQYSLVESIALFDSAHAVVSHDTGPLHMAALTRAAIVAIFGPTDPHTFLPRRPNITALWGGEGLACRPCYDGRNFSPCTHNGCVRQLTVAHVLAELELLLAARASGQPLPPRILAPHSALESEAPTLVTLGRAPA